MGTDRFIVRISNALFKSSLVKGAKTVFPRRIPCFEIKPDEKWVVWGKDKGVFLNVLANKYLCDPPMSLQYGSTRNSVPHIEEVSFQGVMPTAHLSARYEHFKDEFDQTCKKFILDNAIGSNAVSYDVATTSRKVDMQLYNRLVKDLKLTELQDRWAMGLSNGQMRRARLAYSLLKEPDILLFDDPFLGLDPTAASIISRFLNNYQDEQRCSVVIGLRVQDEIPQWCTHICCVDTQEGILFQGPIDQFKQRIARIKGAREAELEKQKHSTNYTIEDLLSPHALYNKPHHEIVKLPHTLELKGLDVQYKGSPVLKDLHWQVAPGSKWHIRGDNGSGKSTLLSLVTAEHPQSWNSKVLEHGEPRKTGKSNYFDINRRIGMSAPELHAIILKNAGDTLTTREAIATGFHDASSNNFIPMWGHLDSTRKQLIEMYMSYFHLENLQHKLIGQLSVSNQKLVLFIRSLIKMPDVLILDEAFSGMDWEPMVRCHELLSRWPGTVLVVSHVGEETPSCDHFLRLIAPGNYEIGDVSHDEL